MPKKYTNSGLRSDLKANSSQYGTEDNAGIGGLNNDDAYATRPNYTHGKALPGPPAVQYPAQLRRDPTRKNDMVNMTLDDNDWEPQMQNTKPAKTCNAKPKVPKRKAPMQVPEIRPTKVNVDMSLQWTCNPQWAAAFIPSLTQALYTSCKPFEDFKRDSAAFLDTIQEVFDTSFPHVEYTLQSSDALVAEACKRLNTRQSKIASDVLEEVKQFFKDCDFADKPESIKDYSLWAVRYDGPGFYQGPTPRQCTYPRDHANYIPTGAFQSHFIINVAKKFLRYVEKSLLEPKIDAKLNPPIGLLGMLLLSVERAFTAYLATGSFISPPDFTHDRYWRELDVYIRQIATLRERNWSEILHMALEENTTRKDNKIANVSTISAFWENLYIPSSPDKPY
ncbi:hypothetical protein BYT27DRAFT_7175602 [Phlegmacium glaucopus]|nr:hypothetical protein BYT27DRAFT_7175602 [Phlegmacium glaucopus]